MKTAPAKTTLTVGGIIADFYDAYGERNAKGVLRLAFKTNLIEFCAAIVAC